MTANTRMAGRRASFVLLALLAAGCASQQPVRPTAFDQSNTRAWFDESNTRSWFAGGVTGSLAADYKADYEEGRELQANQMHAAAVQKYRALAEQGAAEGAYELGKAYRYGWGVQEDPVQAAQWLIAAVSRPNSRRPHASYHLGSLFLEGEGVPRDVILARRLFQQALDGGYKRAALPLARIYTENLGVVPQPEQARRLIQIGIESGDVESYLWLMRAYQPGGVLGSDPARIQALADELEPVLLRRAEAEADPRAMRDLAAIYFEGLGRPRDGKKATGWLVRAARAGEPYHMVSYGKDILRGTNGLDLDPAQGITLLQMASELYQQHEALTLIAEAYRDGTGVPPSDRLAEVWFKKAIVAGDPKAHLEYGRMLAQRKDDATAMAEAAKLFQTAGEAGLPLAWGELGRLHLDRAFPGADPATGVAYLRRAHEAGVRSATADLGRAMLTGTGTAPDPRQAEALLTEAAETGSVEAAEALARAYLSGEMLPPQPEAARLWLERAIAAGSDDAELTMGRALLSGALPGDAMQGHEIVATAASNGDTLAMMDLGRARRDGLTIPEDHEQARAWFLRAQEAGAAEATEALASLDYADATEGTFDIAKLTAAAEGGHAGAMSMLGQAYLEGKQTERSPTLATQWLNKAVDAGNMNAAALLGEAQLYGDHGLTRDPATGQALLQRAADAGVATAERDLGLALILGKAIRPNTGRGLDLLGRAARKGDLHAMELLGAVYLQGAGGVDPNPAESESWLSRAAEKGDLSAMTLLGTAYLEGKVIHQAPDKGLRLLRKAAERNDLTAMSELGWLYLHGHAGVPRDLEQGQRLLQEAAGRGHAGAMTTLGRAYVNGVLGEDKIAEGARLLFRAAQAGHPTAKYALAEAFLRSQGLQGANSEYAETWLRTVVAGDTEVAVRTLTDMLREGNIAAPETDEEWRPATDILDERG